jgi:hypothetical protein
MRQVHSCLSHKPSSSTYLPKTSTPDSRLTPLVFLISEASPCSQRGVRRHQLLTLPQLRLKGMGDLQ